MSIAQEIEKLIGGGDGQKPPAPTVINIKHSRVVIDARPILQSGPTSGTDASNVVPFPRSRD
ncbi:hypothetical protein R77567_01642 [Ralstonia sp. LMG 32965]|uniref:Uncharacterized protein n=1 Tax=Ralstonia flatus TaxID=3058601 RepID=A0AAD2C5V6_9RALS|nr:hypothetical protein R77567_01642 [Ralstonia sp. LMG 32965]